MKYQAIYRCRLCGEILIDEEKTEKLSEYFSAKANLARRRLNLIWGTGNEHEYEHNCKDGSIGIADFQGFKAVEK